MHERIRPSADDSRIYKAADWLPCFLSDSTQVSTGNFVRHPEVPLASSPTTLAVFPYCQGNRVARRILRNH
jgi:hypothetical protein